MKRLAGLLLAGFLAATISGCSSTGSRTTPAEVDDATVTGVGVPGEAAGAETSALGGDSGMSGGDLGPKAPPGTPLAQRVIYFDYDQATVQLQYREVVDAHAEYLRDHDRLIVTLEGHTDPRGSREYNIALGERRGEAVRRSMRLQGVVPQQLEVISYGEERLAREGDDEAAWRDDRRVVIIYSGERP